MDTPTRPVLDIEPTPSTVESHTHHNFSEGPPGRPRYHSPYTRSSVRTPVIQALQQIHVNPWYTSPATKHPSPRLGSLISKFEALHAQSLTFTVRDAQQSHLRLPRSRMGGRSRGEDMQQMKTTRERLLNLAERPGWGARTLRGLREGQDGDASRGFYGPHNGNGRGPFRTHRYSTADQSISPRGTDDNDRWVPSARPRGRHESRIKDKIQFFDRDTDSQPSQCKEKWKWSGSDSAVAFQSPRRHFPKDSTITKPGLYPVSPPKQGTGTLTPVKSYGYLRPKEITPLPWRPLDARRWETDAYLINSPERIRGRLRERLQQPLVTPTPANNATAARKVQIVYQDPKRNISEKASVLSITSREKEQEHSISEIQAQGPERDPSLLTPSLSIRQSAQKHSADEGSAAEAKETLLINEDELVREVGPAKESKIQARISLFSRDGVDVKSFAIPMTQMRNQSTPPKLPSQAASGTPTRASYKVPQPTHISRRPVTKPATDITKPTAIDAILSDVVLETVADQEWAQSQPQEAAARGPALNKQSHINEKIQHFEAFASGQQPSTESVVVNSTGRWPSPQLKRTRTWPTPRRGTTLQHEAQQTVPPLTLLEEEGTRQELKSTTSLAVSDEIETKRDKALQKHRDKERDRQKIHARQERLTRRSRSRLRPARSIAEPSIEQGDTAQKASEYPCQQTHAQAQWERRTANGEAGQGSDAELVMALEIDLRGQRLEDETVQEIWMGGSEDGLAGDVVVLDTVVAECELAEPVPVRLAETLSIINLCRGRVGERSGTGRRRGRERVDLEKGGGLAL